MMHGKPKFSSFWFLILVFAVIWFLAELGILKINIPWLPLIVLVVALGAFINHLIGR